MKRLVKNIIGMCLAVLYASAAWAQSSILKEGIWRATFEVNKEKAPITFEYKTNNGKSVFTAINGERRENFPVTFIGKDSVYIVPETYEYTIFAKIISNGELEGEYRSIVPGNKSRIVPFHAKAGDNYRFVRESDAKPPVMNLTGKWALRIEGAEGDAANRVAVLQQKGNKLTGAILSITGDSGELEGNISGNNFYLSGFIGSGITLVQGTIENDILYGKSGFGPNATKFTGKLDANASLADAYTLTYLKPGYDKLSLSLPDLTGKQISLEDEKFKGKVVIIELLGSWCPNCIDQIKFLAPWYEANKERGVEVIGVAFEAKDDLAFAQKTLQKLITRFDIKYDIVFGGKADKDVVASKFEALNTFLAFPTTIIIGRDGKVREIHTGFSGQGTGEFYDEFVKKWNKELDHLLEEPKPSL